MNNKNFTTMSRESYERAMYLIDRDTDTAMKSLNERIEKERAAGAPEDYLKRLFSFESEGIEMSAFIRRQNARRNHLGAAGMHC